MSITPLPNADFAPTMAGYSGQKPFRFWCQTVLPLVYDDSLSYYELLNKVVNYLNNTIEDVASVEDNVDGLLTAYNQLQDYVNDYFSELDVQEEIDLKLDEMASSGVLDELISPTIAEATSSWLADNVTPVGSAVLVDPTLTIEGAAADAKAVGDRIIKGRSNISLDSMARFYGTITSSVTEMPDFTWIERTGSDMSGLLGSNFTDNLVSSTVYILRKYRIGPSTSQTKRYELMAIGGNIIFVGYETANTTDIVWVDWRTDTTLTKSGKGADAKTVGGKFNRISDVTANLFVFPVPEETADGITITQHKDGTVTLNGSTDETTRATFPLFADGVVFENGGEYIWDLKRVSGPAPTGSGVFVQYYNSGVWSAWPSRTVLNVPVGGYRFRFGVDLNTSFNNTTYQFRAVEGTTMPEDTPSYSITAIDNYARANVADVEGNLYRAEDTTEHGSMLSATGGNGIGYTGYYNYHKTAKMLEIGTEPVKIIVSDAISAVGAVTIWEYQYVNGLISLLSRKTNVNVSTGETVYTPSSGVRYIKITWSTQSQNTGDFGKVEFRSASPIKIVFNPAIKNPDYNNNILFSYPIGGNTYSVGQMILPPNYSVDGKSVPLFVRGHGTGSMAFWNDIFAPGDGQNRKNFEYLANEGFAVLDLYAWTSKYYSSEKQINPVNIAIHQRAYMEAIKYVCDRYNIDVNNICIGCKSLGGNIGHFFMSQTEIPVKAVAMLAPSTSYASTIWSVFFLFKADGGEQLRRRLVGVLGLENDPDADTFITTEYGMLNSTVMTFMRRNMAKFAPLLCGAVNVHGATYDDMFEWSVTGTTTLPQWMVDKGIAKWPANWEVMQDPSNPDPDYPNYLRGTGAPSVIEHPDLSAYSLYPVKFWQAIDDVNTSFHANYTYYQWLLNGGSDVDFRIMPSGTGGHNAVDTSESALKSSGTTRLGITYTDVATAYVEMVDFFYDKMGM